jgi:curved DNA-binding protein CbpA
LDCYAILGLDPGASTESIKIAYRRLARDNHPDLIASRDAETLAAASERMAEINQAYAVLSRTPVNKTSPKDDLSSVTANHETSPPVRASNVHRGANVSAISSSVFGELNQQLRNKLISSGAMRWNEVHLEGFELGLTGGSWHSRYGIALRGFAATDAVSISKLTNYAELAIQRSRSYFRRQFFLFVVPFQRISSLEQVAASCRRFCSAQKKWAQVNIALVDVAHGRSLLCGVKIHDTGFTQIIDTLGLDPKTIRSSMDFSS